jgi:hypothetical protein
MNGCFRGKAASLHQLFGSMRWQLLLNHAVSELDLLVAMKYQGVQGGDGRAGARNKIG